MTKYEPTHEWVKDLKLKGTMAQLADSATDHMGKIIDNSKVTDYAFLSSWVALAYVLYTTGATKTIMGSADYWAHLIWGGGASTNALNIAQSIADRAGQGGTFSQFWYDINQLNLIRLLTGQPFIER